MVCDSDSFLLYNLGVRWRDELGWKLLMYDRSLDRAILYRERELKAVSLEELEAENVDGNN
jgi:hypothetical protein